MKNLSRKQINAKLKANYDARCGLDERMDNLITMVMEATGINIIKVINGGEQPVFEDEAKKRWFAELMEKYEVYKVIITALDAADETLEQMLEDSYKS